VGNQVSIRAVGDVRGQVDANELCPAALTSAAGFASFRFAAIKGLEPPKIRAGVAKKFVEIAGNASMPPERRQQADLPDFRSLFAIGVQARDMQ
jgi:hypothetical protein